MMHILYTILSISGLALIFGALLGFSSKKFAVQIDPKVEKIINVLPGANCGGCGFAGCAVFAEAVVKSGAGYNDCPVGGVGGAKKIAETLGIDPTASEKKVAFVRCNGKDENVKRKYIYEGAKNCITAVQLATGGNKSCIYSCIGHGSCKHACPFGAINIVDSVAEVDESKCTACGKCVQTCPKKLIEIVPEKSKVRVRCNSKDTGKTVRLNCRAGCIGCKACQRACKSDAITVEDNLSRINYEKCTLCMECVNKCPIKVIQVMP